MCESRAKQLPAVGSIGIAPIGDIGGQASQILISDLIQDMDHVRGQQENGIA